MDLGREVKTCWTLSTAATVAVMKLEHQVLRNLLTWAAGWPNWIRALDASLRRLRALLFSSTDQKTEGGGRKGTTGRKMWQIASLRLHRSSMIQLFLSMLLFSPANHICICRRMQNGGNWSHHVGIFPFLFCSSCVQLLKDRFLQRSPRRRGRPFIQLNKPLIQLNEGVCLDR